MFYIAKINLTLQKEYNKEVIIKKTFKKFKNIYSIYIFLIFNLNIQESFSWKRIKFGFNFYVSSFNKVGLRRRRKLEFFNVIKMLRFGLKNYVLVAKKIEKVVKKCNFRENIFFFFLEFQRERFLRRKLDIWCGDSQRIEGEGCLKQKDIVCRRNR